MVKGKVKSSKKEFKAGKAVPYVEGAGCLDCMNWKKCPSKRKSHDYACTRLKLYPIKAESTASPLNAPNIITDPKQDLDKGLGKEERVISQLITSTLEGSGVTSLDSRLDDRDIPTAPNFFTWITDPKFYGEVVPVPWAKQIEHPTNLFSELCPRCSDMKFWRNVPVDATASDIQARVTFLHYGKCPSCSATKSELISAGELNPYNALVGLAGQRVSKSFLVVAMALYDLHRLIKSQNPPAMLGVASSQVLTGSFVALTFEQAKTTMWNTMYNAFSDATWFKNYQELIKDQSYKYGIENPVEIKQTYARFRHRNLLYHISGPSKRTLRGSTRVCAACDEIGWFTLKLKGKTASDPERLDAPGLHEALDRSLLTVRGGADRLLMSGANNNVSMGYMYEVSSPQAKNDMIMRLYEQSKGSKTVYGFRMATWEGNPLLPRDSSAIVEAYRVDYAKANRDYGAVPPVSGNPFVKLSSLKETFSKRPNGGQLKTTTMVNAQGGQQTTGKLKKLRTHSGEASVLTVDAGYNNNSFAVCIMYANEQTGELVVPFIGEIMPSQDMPAHFPDIADSVLGPLIEHYNVSLVVSDRWQNIMLLQSLAAEYEVFTETKSVKYPDFDAFRQDAIYDNRLVLPALESRPKEAIKMAAQPGYPQIFINQPISHLLYQLVAVVDIPNVDVTKPEGGTDDLFRSLVLAYASITNPEWAEFFDQAESRPKHAVGVMRPGIPGIGVTVGVTNKMGVARSAPGGSSMSKSIGVLSTRSR